MEKSFNVAVLGTGAWATALACCARLNGHVTKLWGISPSEVSDINQGVNRHYFGDQKLFARPVAYSQLEEVIISANVVIIAVPSLAVEEVVNKIIDCWQKHGADANHLPIDIINVAKGFDPNTNDLWSKTLKRQLAKCKFTTNLVTLIGPSFAIDVIQKLPTAVNAVSQSPDASGRIKKILSTDFFIVKTINDENGAQVLSALKNFLAIFSGMMYEAFGSENTQAMILTMGINEIRSFHRVFDFQQTTLFELCGIGDILLTGSSNKSRNFSFGQRLVAYNSVTKAKEQGGTVEGYSIYPIIEQIIKQHHLKLPIFQMLIDVLNQKITPQDATRQIVKILH